MLKYISIIILFLVSACSINQDEPDIPEYNSRVSDEIEPEFVGAYVTGDLKDKIELFANYVFYYQEDCNNQKRINDWNTWRIGKWEKADSIINLHYEDGGEASAMVILDTLFYLEGDKTGIFFPSSKVTVTVTIDPTFNK